jgi:hypothetical protein
MNRLTKIVGDKCSTEREEVLRSRVVGVVGVAQERSIVVRFKGKTKFEFGDKFLFTLCCCGCKES